MEPIGLKHFSDTYWLGYFAMLRGERLYAPCSAEFARGWTGAYRETIEGRLLAMARAISGKT